MRNPSRIDILGNNKNDNEGKNPFGNVLRAISGSINNINKNENNQKTEEERLREN